MMLRDDDNNLVTICMLEIQFAWRVFDLEIIIECLLEPIFVSLYYYTV